MNRSATAAVAAVALAVLTAAGCGARPSGPDAAAPSPGSAQAPAPTTPQPPSQAPPAEQPKTAPAPPAPIDLGTVKSNYDLTMDQLVEALPRFLNQDAGSPHDKLAALFLRWGLKENHDGKDLETLLLTEADLNGDGTAETLAAINAKHGSVSTEGAVFVIYREGGQYKVDRTVDGGEPGAGSARGVTIQAVADLTGDGRPEILWSVQDHGAHTAYAYFNVSAWAPGKMTQLPGQFFMSFPTFALDGQDFLLSGGGIGSAGAGMLQRSRTDRYHWDGAKFALVDQRYAPSDFTYHRLQDGILAETYGRMQDAIAAYRGALGVPQGKLLGNVEPEWLERFKAAVPAYARFRLGVLLLKQGDAPGARRAFGAADGPYAGISLAVKEAESGEAACQAAQNWASANPELLTALSKTMGYANPTWTPAQVCGPLPKTPR